MWLNVTPILVYLPHPCMDVDNRVMKDWNVVLFVGNNLLYFFYPKYPALKL